VSAPSSAPSTLGSTRPRLISQQEVSGCFSVLFRTTPGRPHLIEKTGVNGGFQIRSAVTSILLTARNAALLNYLRQLGPVAYWMQDWIENFNSMQFKESSERCAPICVSVGYEGSGGVSLFRTSLKFQHLRWGQIKIKIHYSLFTGIYSSLILVHLKRK